MGFPLAGGPNDDVSSFLSRDLFQQHMDKGNKGSKKFGAKDTIHNNQFIGPDPDFLTDDIFAPFMPKKFP